MKKIFILIFFLFSLINVEALPTKLWNYSAGGNIYCVDSADLDNDGLNEVIYGANDGFIAAIDSNGELLWNYSTGSKIYVVYPKDIDNSGSIEILAGDYDGMVYALSNQGNLIWNYSVGICNAIRDIVAADIDNDGNIEVIIGSDCENVTVLDKDGDLVWNYNATQDVSDVDVIDYNDDNKLEIVAGTGASNDQKGLIILISHTGSQIWNFSVGNDVCYSLSVGDLDGDGISDIATGSDEVGKIFAIKSNGTKLWEYSTTGDTSNPYGRGLTAIGDINADGKNEVVGGSGSGDHGVYAISSDGDLIWNYTTTGWVYSVYIADLRSDNKKEVIVGTAGMNSTNNTVCVLSSTGALIKKYEYENYVVNVRAKDLDNDGLAEVIAGCWDNNVYTYKFDRNDLFLNVEDILFSDDEPKKGDNITITAKISKEKGEIIKNVNVTFYANDTYIGSVLVDFSYSEYVNASINWTVEHSITEIKVVIDPNDDISESNETNNVAFTSILTKEDSDENFLSKYGFYIFIGLIAVFLLIVILKSR